MKLRNIQIVIVKVYCRCVVGKDSLRIDVTLSENSSSWISDMPVGDVTTVLHYTG